MRLSKSILCITNYNSKFELNNTGDFMEDADVLAGLPDEDSLFDLAELFKVFGDSTRIKILFVLLKNSMAVNTIAEALNMTQSAVSHQLRILKTNGLVKYERNGKSLIYSLADDHVTSILNQGLDHIGE